MTRQSGRVKRLEKDLEYKTQGWRSRGLEQLLEHGKPDEVLDRLREFGDNQQRSIVQAVKHRLGELFEEPLEERLAYSAIHGEIRALRVFRQLQQEGAYDPNELNRGSNGAFHPYVKLANDHGRKARVHYLPTPTEVMKYIAVQDVTKLDGAFNYSDAVTVGEGSWRALYAAGIRQALSGIRGQVKAFYHRCTHSYKSEEVGPRHETHNLAYPHGMSETGVNVLAGLADAARQRGFMTEFEVTLHGKQRGVKAFVYVSPELPIVAVSTARLYVENLKENMVDYHSEKSMQLIAQRKKIERHFSGAAK